MCSRQTKICLTTKLTEMVDSHRKINIVCDLPIRFGSKQVKVEHLFDREREREREPTEREREREEERERERDERFTVPVTGVGIVAK